VTGACFDACVEHQLDRAVGHATGEAGKDGGHNPECHALIMANRKMVSKILTSTQLQEGLRRHQINAGIRKSWWSSSTARPGGRVDTCLPVEAAPSAI
jgi:hypothetical protein